VEVLLNSGTTELVMSLKFARKQRFKLKKVERFIYIRNVNGSFNKKRLICYNSKLLELGYEITLY